MVFCVTINWVLEKQEIKQGFLAQRCEIVVVANIKKLMLNYKNKLTTYKDGSAMEIVPMGRYVAVAELLFGTTIGCIPGRINSKDLFVGKTRKGLGLTS